jgi:hypothetical protein
MGKRVGFLMNPALFYQGSNGILHDFLWILQVWDSILHFKIYIEEKNKKEVATFGADYSNHQ